MLTCRNCSLAPAQHVRLVLGLEVGVKDSVVRIEAGYGVDGFGFRVQGLLWF